MYCSIHYGNFLYWLQEKEPKVIIFLKTVEKAFHNAEKNIEIHQETAENEHFEILANQFRKVLPDFERFYKGNWRKLGKTQNCSNLANTWLISIIFGVLKSEIIFRIVLYYQNNYGIAILPTRESHYTFAIN